MEDAARKPRRLGFTSWRWVSYDRQGQPLDALTWDRLINDHAYVIVAQDEVGGWQVVTFWAGMDAMAFHRILGGWDGIPPLIFETAIRDPAGTSVFVGPARYCTEELALAGHERALAWVREQAGS